ncbi:hypothetical protein T4A_657 [Trichinella pseudospiralis]|uniref:Uncharacterized protein n=1 Tax=Trichinella pseudospiralis TaxID=6337 RepID=A0A0V1EW46_TRIPS|nr:hypothetical protein T4A_657 [Trichinella pseudospiralis]KRZ41500.1 hypothetical protein T4C_294 [Trichinella pseudospiralis]
MYSIQHLLCYLFLILVILRNLCYLINYYNQQIILPIQSAAVNEDEPKNCATKRKKSKRQKAAKARWAFNSMFSTASFMLIFEKYL